MPQYTSLTWYKLDEKPPREGDHVLMSIGGLVVAEGMYERIEGQTRFMYLTGEPVDIGAGIQVNAWARMPSAIEM